MKTLTLHLPDQFDMDEQEAKMMLAAKLYEMGKLSIGEAAELVNLSKDAFMGQLANYGVSYFNQSPDELDKDIENAQKYSL